MYDTAKNTIEFRVWGKYALFTDPITKIGGEKCSYHIPTYEALKGICKSIYWKPTIIWIVDSVRVMKRIQTQTKGVKPLKYSSGGNDLSIYTFLKDVEYQVRAHFEMNQYQAFLEKDRIDGKHYQIAQRMLERGGRQDIFLGTRDCQGYVEPCSFGEGSGAYDKDEGEVQYSLMFHGFNYPDETGIQKLSARFFRPVMRHGRIDFLHPDNCDPALIKEIRVMHAKKFGLSKNVKPVEQELKELEECK